jgi:hypothetical protein
LKKHRRGNFRKRKKIHPKLAGIVSVSAAIAFLENRSSPPPTDDKYVVLFARRMSKFMTRKKYIFSYAVVILLTGIYSISVKNCKSFLKSRFF